MTIRIDSWLELVDVEQFGVPGRGAAYIVQGEGLALIETGTARSAAILRAALRGRDLRFIFVTHIHLDHAGGAGYIAADHPEATVVASPRAIPHLIDPTRLIRGVREASPELFPLYGEPGPIPEERLHPASDSEVFDLGGGIAIEAVNSPGHAPHHVSFFERSHPHRPSPVRPREGARHAHAFRRPPAKKARVHPLRPERGGPARADRTWPEPPPLLDRADRETALAMCIRGAVATIEGR